MKQAKQVDLLKTMLEMIDNGTAPDAGRLVKNPTSSYVCKDLAQREWDTFFANHPQILGLSSDLPEPASFMTSNDLGIPILATRDKQGNFHAFINSCRHRGAILTGEERGKQERFACPFHAWTYANDGQLLGIREPKLFGEIDKSCHGLVKLPSAEKYGFLVVHPRVNGRIDVDELLGDELSEQLDSWDFGAARYLGGSSVDYALNWKFANDVFGENYHFDTLHAEKFDNIFYSDASAFDAYGRNHRLTVASRFVDAMRERPEDQWNVSDAGIVVYYLFPNVQIELFNRIISVFRIYPNRNEVGRCMTRISHYSAPHIGTDVADEVATVVDGATVYNADTTSRIEFTLESLKELIDSTLEEEDYFIGAKSQQTADSRMVEDFIFGRNEPALHHFHESYREALGMPPLEEYRAG